MEPLPYFLLLLKKNVLLCSIIAHGSFAQVDLSHVEHITRSEKCVTFRNFRLDDETFSSVDVILMEESTSITFLTINPDYYDHPERYFQRSGMERNSHPYTINGQEARTRRKRIGDFKIFEEIPPASIYVMQSSIYGYAISIDFYKFNLTTVDKE